jgi:hypothetical protein
MALVDFEDKSDDCYRHLIDEDAGSFYLRSKINSDLLDDTTQLVNQTWYYFVSTFNDTSNLNVIYKNASNVGSASPSLNFDVAAERLCIGATTNGGLSAVGSFFKGYIGEVHIYDRDLTSAEVTQNFNATKQGMDYKYKIYPISQLDSIDWSKFTHTPETCRKSLDGTQFIVRFAVEPHGEHHSLDSRRSVS